MLLNAGSQEPLMPLVEIVGNGDIDVPEQIGAIGENIGLILVFTLI